MQKLLNLLDASATALISLDPNDMVGLVHLHDRFIKMKDCAVELEKDPQQFLHVQSASDTIAALIEKIIHREIDDTQQAIRSISEAISRIRNFIQDISQGKAGAEIILGPLLDFDQLPNQLPSNPRGMTLPQNVDEDIFQEFVGNQPHVLETLEAVILASEKEPTTENIDAVKAILHSIKGESGLMGLEAMADACHQAESLIDEGENQFPAQKILETKDFLLEAINQLIASHITSTDSNQQNTQTQPPKKEPDQSEDAAPQKKVQHTDQTQVPQILIAEGDVSLVMDFISEAMEHLESGEANLLKVEKNPGDKEIINAIFRGFHTIKGVAGFLNLTQITSLAHVTENLLDQVRKDKLVLAGTGIDVVFESTDVMGKLIELLRDAVENNLPVQSYQGLDNLIERLKACTEGEVTQSQPTDTLAPQGSVPLENTNKTLKEQKDSSASGSMGQIPIENTQPTSPPVQKTAQLKKFLIEREKRNTHDTTVKVTTSRLDAMINMVGELVIAQAMVSQDLVNELKENERLERNIRHLNKITRDLQGLSMSMRMVPVQAVFQKMARLVRDLSRKSQKKIELSISGAETEIDRNVVEAIADPLVHMIRNSVDHGIETPEERQKCGKSPLGTIQLKACHKGGNIVIEISDDGKGLNTQRILEKAQAAGIVNKDQVLTDEEIFGLIFHPGLSTADKITDVSGRGVGMDVVRKNIESLRGHINIHSGINKGTRFTIRLPLTLAVIDGQIVTVGKERYIVPIIAIEQCLKPTPEQISTLHQRAEMINIRDQLIPLVRLHKLFDVEPLYTETLDALFVVVGDGADRCCLMVDSILGQQQVVIKSLGEYYGSIQGVSGGAIMGDGNISLILDVPGLIKLAAGNVPPLLPGTPSS